MSEHLQGKIPSLQQVFPPTNLEFSAVQLMKVVNIFTMNIRNPQKIVTSPISLYLFCFTLIH